MPHFEETFLQKDFTHYLDAKGHLYTASMAGMKLSGRLGNQKKKMGCKAGLPDIMIFEPRGKYHGLFIELKSPTGKATPEQRWWQQELTKRGYLSEIMPTGLEYPQSFYWLRDLVEKQRE